MKVVLYDEDRLGRMRDGRIVNVMSALRGIEYHGSQQMIEAVITGWSDIEPRIKQATDSGRSVAVEPRCWLPPVPRPAQLVCLARNYTEPDKPERGPFNAFLKSPNALIGCGCTVELPPVEAKYFHFEPELAVVIGKTAVCIAASEAMDYVYGYTQFLDGSARGLPGGFFLCKSWHTFGPMGPALVTADEVPDPNDLLIRMWVNDELRHNFSTCHMDRTIPELLEQVTKVMRLEPGDVVSTGTHHYGLAPIEDGDRLRLEIEGFGAPLVVQVHDPLKRSSWPSD